VRRIWLVSVLLAALGFAPLAGLAAAAGSWLDAPLASWTAPGGSVPTAEPSGVEPAADPRCTAALRPPETPEDEAVVAAGWSLFGTYESGWNVRIVRGLVGHDGMCRPAGYNIFVFVGGAFAGTLSPEPMVARTDGAAGSIAVFSGQDLAVTFARYAETDPLCCPSGSTTVQYRLEQTTTGPAVVPISATSSPR
jgi:hypothetical protein